MKRTGLWALALAAMLVAALVAGCAGGSDNGTTTPPADEGTPPVTEPSTSTGGETPADVADVAMSGLSFSPATLEVSAGTTVRWTNQDSVPHTVTGDGFESGSLSAGDTFEFTFDSAGTFPYECTIHPGMSGGIVVK